MDHSPAPEAKGTRSFQLFALLIAAGMLVAGWQAYNWADLKRSRNLIVVAPDGTNIRTIDGPTLIDQTQGVHTWSVLPGSLTLEVDFEGYAPQRTTVLIPKGLGGLMLAVNPDDDGALMLAYF